jgi:hypothetical protein
MWISRVKCKNVGIFYNNSSNAWFCEVDKGGLRACHPEAEMRFGHPGIAGILGNPLSIVKRGGYFTCHPWVKVNTSNLVEQLVSGDSSSIRRG